jgi:hypothetical protein
MPEKLRPENPGQKQQIRPEIPGLLVPEKVRPENPGSNYRYGRKIRLPVTADTSGKSRQVTTRYGRKIRLPVTTETAGKCQQETVTDLQTRLQWRSGRTPGSQSEGRRFAPTLCSIYFPLHRRKIPVAQKLN